MAYIYFALVDTPGLFAGMIRRVIRQKYIHVAISLDSDLQEAYSIGRRFPSVPLIAGFEKEEKEKIFRAFPEADYMICSIECTKEQKKYVEDTLRDAMRNRFCYHYAVLGLPFILMNRPFYQKNHYTCSSYAAKVLSEAGICSFGKHFSLVTPKDFYEFDQKEVLFEGKLKQLIHPVYRNTVFAGVNQIPFFAPETSQSPCLHVTLATAYNPAMRLLALPVINPVPWLSGNPESAGRR